MKSRVYIDKKHHPIIIKLYEDGFNSVKLASKK